MNPGDRVKWILLVCVEIYIVYLLKTTTFVNKIVLDNLIIRAKNFNNYGKLERQLPCLVYITILA
jgi:hypothetical protein